MSWAAKEGYKLFIGRAGCAACHHLGLYEITQQPEDRWKYKTPSLRDVALTAPYMHDGSLTGLREVVEFYNRSGIVAPAIMSKH